MTDEGKAAAELAIDRIKASGGTNLSGGLFKGIDQHQQAAGQGAPSPSTNGDSGRCKRASSCCYVILCRCPAVTSLLNVWSGCTRPTALSVSFDTDYKEEVLLNFAWQQQVFKSFHTCLHGICRNSPAQGFHHICVPFLPTNSDLLKVAS